MSASKLRQTFVMKADLGARPYLSQTLYQAAIIQEVAPVWLIAKYFIQA